MLLLALTFLVLLTMPQLGYAAISATKHNLSLSGPGPIKAAGQDQICIFCHIPHNANPAVPLWGHTVNGGGYTIYTSPTIQGTTGQPNGSSKLCLGCHDGAVAIGSVSPTYSARSGGIPMTGTTADGKLPAGSTNLGMDLSNDHPVSIVASAWDPEVITNPTDTRVKYDSSGRVQCTSCHDPHDNTYGKFLVKPNVDGGNFGSQLCIVCHSKFNWGNSPHRTSEKLNGTTPIKAQACAACHQVHTAPIPSYLLAGAEEGICNTCHDGSPAGKNIAGEFALPYRHPTDTVSGKHNPAESFTTLNDPLFRHAECTDCHSPHGAQTGTHTQGSSKIGAALVGAWGMKPIYSTTPWTEPVSWQKVTFTDTTGPDMLEAYLCFKCHKNLAKAFNPNNPSYHAVVGDSKADATVNGSYLNGWTPTSRMTCTDCHRSSSGVKGPHGSSFAENAHPEPTQNWAVVSDPIIAFADYLRGGGHGPSMASPHWTNRGTGGTYDGYGNPRSSDNDLCFQCHNRRVYGHPTDNTYYYVGANMTGYRGPYYPDQNLHIRHMRGKACTTCHVVHGSNKPHLLAFGSDDFDLNSRLYVAGPIPAGGGWSYVTCHGGSYTGC